MTSSDRSELEEILYPKGTNFDEGNLLSILLEEYKLFVETSEKLVARRQTVNAFFLSMNAALISAVGVIMGQAASKIDVALSGVIGIGLAGILLCISWRRLVNSHRQLNTGKFVLIENMEKYLPAALFKAEWHALGKGQDNKKYMPFTRTESVLPFVFILLYAVAAIVSLVYLIN
jgi:hypothetical protein